MITNAEIGWLRRWTWARYFPDEADCPKIGILPLDMPEPPRAYTIYLGFGSCETILSFTDLGKERRIPWVGYAEKAKILVVGVKI